MREKEKVVLVFAQNWRLLVLVVPQNYLQKILFLLISSILKLIQYVQSYAGLRLI